MNFRCLDSMVGHGRVARHDRYDVTEMDVVGLGEGQECDSIVSG